MCSSMLLVVQSTIMTPSMVRGSAPSPTTISFVLTRSWAAAAVTKEATAAMTSATTTRPRVLPMRLLSLATESWVRSVARQCRARASAHPPSPNPPSPRMVTPSPMCAVLWRIAVWPIW